jgi:5-methylcytosine-specific restriction endonuclease McrA
MATAEEQREYQRIWIANRRSQWIAEHGPCALCGSSERLEVDHTDPTQKLLKPARLWSMSPKNPRRIAELAKCRVLCYDCHMAKSKNEKLQGEDAPHAKLTTEDILAIRESKESYRALGARYKVCYSTIGKIKRMERWTHLKG